MKLKKSNVTTYEVIMYQQKNSTTMSMPVLSVNSEITRKHFLVLDRLTKPVLRTNHNVRLDRGNKISLIFNAVAVDK